MGTGRNRFFWLQLGLRKTGAFLREQVLAFARDSERRPIELKQPLLQRYGLEAVLALVIFAFFITSFGPTILFQAERWNAQEPVLKLGMNRWIVLFEEGFECGDILRVDCVGHPEHQSLWESPLRLSDSDFMARAKEFRNKKFWVGVELSPDDVKLALEKKAFVLQLGMLNGSYKTFLNGVLMDSGSGRDILPAAIQLSVDKLRNEKAIRIAIEINHNLGSRIPAWFPAGMSGLFTHDAHKASMGYWSFSLSYMPLVISLWAFLFALTFMSLWISVPKKVEYFYFGLYLFVFSMIRILPFAPIAWGAMREVLYKGDYWLVASEGTLACLLGASYARVRRIYFFWALSIGAIVSILGYMSVGNHIELYRYKDMLMKYFIPTMFSLGALFCFSQAYFVHNQWKKFMTKKVSQVRQFRLIVFGSLLAVFGAVFYFQNSLPESIVPQFIDRNIQLFLLGLIGLNLFVEYRDREKQFEIVQRSPFHDPFGGSSAEVFGFVLGMDLISSSKLANFAAEIKSYQRPVTVWNNLVGQIMAKHRGFKVADEGDGLKIVFPLENSEQGLMEVLNALSEVKSESEKLEMRLKQENLIPSTSFLRFRAGIVWGGIHPIWKDFLGVKSAEWEDAKGLTTFKDVQRIMDLEKQISTAESKTLVFIASKYLTESSFLQFDAKRINMNVRDVGSIDLWMVELSKSSTSIAA